VATDNEEVLEEPALSTSTTAESDPTAAVREFARWSDQKVNSSVNASQASVQTAPVPVLPEVTLTGYRAGAPEQVLCVQIGGFYLEKYTGYDFLLMQRAAEAAGIRLDIVSAFRLMEEQERLYRERQDPRIRARKGQAARPGFSNHQSAIAADIRVNMTVADKAQRRYSKEYLWLKENAALYGFDNEEVPSEPWHWRHRERRLVGQAVDLSKLQSSIRPDGALLAAVDNGRINYELFASRDLYDKTKAMSRSIQMQTTSRDTIFANLGEASVYQSAGALNYVALYTKARQQAREELPKFKEETLDALVYNFETGEWGDKEPV